MNVHDAAERYARSLHLVRLTFEVESLARFWLPDWPGSMLRGALGGCLKLLDDAGPAAPYAELYRHKAALDGRAGDAETDTPRPYIVEWPQGPGRVMQPGDRFTFDVLLIGRAVAHAPAVLAGASHAVEAGLGTARVPHRLVGVRFGEGGASGVSLADIPDPLPSRLPDELHLTARTPLLLNREPRIARRPTAEMLFMAALRRLRQVAAAHGDGLLSPLRVENELQGRLGGVRLDASAMQWIETERLSRNSPRALRLSGLLGDFTLSGDLEPLRPLLRAALVLHAGRQVSMGMGRIGVARADAAEASSLAGTARTHAVHPIVATGAQRAIS